MTGSEKHIKLFKKSLNDFSPISNKSFDQLLSIVKLRSVKKGEYLLQLNQVAKKIHFVCEGIVTSLYVTNDGNTHIKNFFLEGNLAGSTVSLLKAVPSDFGLQVLEDSIIIDMDFGQYMQLIKNNDDLKDYYINYLEQNWVIKNEKRQIAFATQAAAERYQTFLEEYPNLEERMPQLHIASYLGITPTQLSRIRKELKK